MEHLESTFLTSFLEMYPASMREVVTTGIQGLRLEAAQLGIEVLRAEHRGISYADASLRPGDFPLMARVHHGVVDLLQLELGTEETAGISAFLEHASQMDMSGFETTCFSIAALDEQSPQPALFRFLVFQMLRLSIWVSTWRSGGAALEAVGVLHELDREAELTLRWRCRQTAMKNPEIRPMRVLIAELYEQLERIWNQRREEILAHRRRSMDAYVEQLIRACSMAREADAADAALLRNQIDAELGRDSIQLIPLAERHPLAFASASAAKQRQKRMRDKLLASRSPKATRDRV